MYYSGIDQHKRDCMITTYDADGHRVKQQRVPNVPPQLRRYFTAFTGPHHAVVESTGFWYWLADLLDDLGVELILAHATRLKAIAAAKVKTDRLDSDLLAQLLRAGLIPKAHRIAREARGPRDLLRLRVRLVEKRISCLNSLERIREKHHITNRNALDPWYQHQVDVSEAQLALLAQQIHDLEVILHPHLIPNADIQRLLWVPGIGKVNAFTIWTEVDGIARFPSEGQFLSYCRVVPGADNSGGRTRHRSGAKAGNRYLKLAFSHASVRAIQYYPVIKAFYQKHRRRKPVIGARAIVAAELARIVYQVLTKREDFNGLFRGMPLPRTKTRQWPRLATPAAELGRGGCASGHALDWGARRRATRCI
ncbi:MAG: IS110 family transposase [Pseudomonadales bacterium]|nr:IS110 family transposase [Pseudomonadales bacterium]NIX06987.1 IS110 family transposase [Pseudomonadales bacterium]